MNDIIEANFSPQFKLEVFQSIKQNGIKRTEKLLIEHGLNQSFIKAIIRNITRTMGW